MEQEGIKKTLDLQEKFLYSPYIEKKIQAINEMVRLIKSKVYPYPEEKMRTMEAILSR